MIVSLSDNQPERRYVPLNDVKKELGIPTINQDGDAKNFIPSKVMVIENLSITAVQNLNEEFSFKVDTKFGILSDNMTIPKVDIMANVGEVNFDEDMTLDKLKYIIRRSGILERYKGFFTNDPDIVINSYTLNVRKDYQFFEEFMNGVLIAEEIFE